MKKFYDRTREMTELKELQHQAYNDFEIDIVAETLEGNVEAYEVKRNMQRFSPTRLDEKVTEMKRRIFRGKEITKIGLSMEDM